MHEIGFDVTNINPNTGTPRNPYNVNAVTGGSSGGSACSVAAGLCPLSIGADGGGSIRIPSSHCGVYGLKPTAGRVSGVGSANLAPVNFHFDFFEYNFIMCYFSFKSFSLQEIDVFVLFFYICFMVPFFVFFSFEIDGGCFRTYCC